MKFWNKLTAKQKALSVVGGVASYFILFIIGMFIHPVLGVSMFLIPALCGVLYYLYEAALDEFKNREDQ